MGIEPTIEDLQSPALPLGYGVLKTPHPSYAPGISRLTIWRLNYPPHEALERRWNRTIGKRIKSPLLCQLSYTPLRRQQESNLRAASRQAAIFKTASHANWFVSILTGQESNLQNSGSKGRCFAIWRPINSNRKGGTRTPDNLLPRQAA